MTSEQNMVFEVAGEGVPVLLVHGLGGTANVWAGQAGILARHFKVVRPDLPGSGRSPFSGTLSTGSLVAALHALLDSNALGAVHLVGHSYGSIVCQHFAAQHPQSVRSLALMGAFAAPPDPVRGVLRERAAAARGGGRTPMRPCRTALHRMPVRTVRRRRDSCASS